MNGVDIAILVIVGISVVYGVYHGFLQTALSVASFLLAVWAAFIFGPSVSALIRNNSGITTTLSTYTDAVARVGDVDLAQTNAAALDSNGISRVLKAVGLPDVLADTLEKNLAGRTLAGEGAVTVNDYVKSTLVNAAVNVGSYVAVFVVTSVVLGLVCSLIKHVFKFPPLRMADGAAGGVFGLCRGVIIVYVLFLMVPIVATVVPRDIVTSYVSESTLAPLFQSGGYFAKVIAGK